MKIRKPDWFKAPLSDPAGLKVRRLLKELDLNTVCDQAHCPNIGECYNRGAATFLIMGEVCTRNCRFCAISSGVPLPLDPEEPLRVAQAVRKIRLRHCVITGVNRDDLPLGGAEHYAQTIRCVREYNPDTSVEVLPGDFSGSVEALETVLYAVPYVFNHNLETVERLTPLIRDPRADYRLSLRMLRLAKGIRPQVLTKSGIIIGLGETLEEIVDALEDLRQAGCDGVTIGQYIPPSPEHYPVKKFYRPEDFIELDRIARSMGFKGIASGPLVRSSYHAADFFNN